MMLPHQYPQIDYEIALDLGVNVLNLAPQDVWQMTPDELMSLLKARSDRQKKLTGGADSKMTRDRAKELLEQFPDHLVARPVTDAELQEALNGRNR